MATASVLLLILSGNLWAATYRWKTDGVDGDWSNYQNWEYNTSGSNYRAAVAGEVPGTGDTVYFRGSNGNATTVTVTGNISCERIFIGSDQNAADNGTVTIDATGGKLTAKYIYMFNQDGDLPHNVTLVIKGDVTCEGFDIPATLGDFNISLIIEPGATLTVTGNMWLDTSDNKTITITGGGTLNCNNIKTDYNGGNKTELILDPELSLQTTSGNYTFSITPALDFNTVSTITITDSVNTDYPLKVIPTVTDSDLTTTEVYKINGNTFTSGDEIPVTASGNTATFTVELPDNIDNSDGIEISIKDNNDVEIKKYSFTSNGRPTTSIWNGTSWSTEPHSGTRTILFRGDYSGETPARDFSLLNNINIITIYEGDISLGQIKANKLNIETGTSLMLQSDNISVTSLTNKGTIIFTDDGRLVDASSNPVMDNLQGTVEYNSSDSTTREITDYHSGDKSIADYNNLKIVSGNWKLSGTSIKAAESFENNASLTLEADSEIASDFTNTGTLYIAEDTASEIQGNFTNNGGTVEVYDNATLWFTDNCETITDNGSWNFYDNGSHNVYGQIKFGATNKDITFTTDSSVNQYVINNEAKTAGSVSFTGPAAKMIVASYTDASSSCAVSFNSVSFPNQVNFNPKVEGSNITFQNTVTFASGADLTGTTEIYNDVVCDGGTPATTDDSDFSAVNIKLYGNSTINAKSITISGTIETNAAGYDLGLNATNGALSIDGKTNLGELTIGEAGKEFKNISFTTNQNLSFTTPDIYATDTINITTTGSGNLTFENTTFTTNINVISAGLLTIKPAAGAVNNQLNPPLALKAKNFSFSSLNTNFSGTIELTGTDDLIIDQTVNINNHLHFKTSGNFILDDTSTIPTGNINSTNTDCYIQITAGSSKKIFVNNDVCSSTRKCGYLILNSPVQMDKAHNIYALTTDFAAGCTSITVTDAADFHYTVSDNLIVEADISFPTDAVFEISGSFTNKANPVFSKGLKVGKDFTDTAGTWTTIPEITLNGTNNEQKFAAKPSTEYSNLIIDKTGTNAAVNFVNGITLTEPDVTSFTGKILFTGTEEQIFKAEPSTAYSNIIVNKAVFDLSGTRTGASTGKLIITNSTTPTALSQGSFTAGSFDIQNGSVSLSNMDVVVNSSINWASPDSLIINGGNTTDAVSITANRFSTKGNLITEADTYFEINTSDPVNGGSITIDKIAGLSEGDIGSAAKAFKYVHLNTGIVSGRNVSVGGKIWTESYELTTYSVSLSNAQGINDVTIHAQSISIDGITADTLSLNPDTTDPADATIKLGGNINLTGTSDFVIDYPLQILNGTFYEADGITPVSEPAYDLVLDVNGNIFIEDRTGTTSVGSINKNTGSKIQFITPAAKAVTIKNGETANAGFGTAAAPLTTVDFTGNLTLDQATGIYSGEVIFSGNDTEVSGAGSLSVTGDIDVKKDTESNSLSILCNISASKKFTNTKATISGTGNVSLGGNFEDKGIWNNTGSITITNQYSTTFTAKHGTTYNEVIVDSDGKTVEFKTKSTDGTDNTVAITTLHLKKATSVTFNADSDIGSYKDEADTAATLTFTGKETKIGSFDNDTINTTGTVTFNSETSTLVGTSLASLSPVIHTAGNTTVSTELSSDSVEFGDTKVSGSITTKNSQIYNDLELEADSTLETTQSGTSVTLKGTQITGDYTLTLITPELIAAGTSNLLSITPALTGDTTTAKDLTVTGSVEFNSTVDNYKDFLITTNATFNDSFGNGDTTPTVATLHVQGTTTINAANISTSGSQTYDNQVTFSANSELTASQINFKNKIDGSGKSVTFTTSVVTISDDIDIEPELLFSNDIDFQITAGKTAVFKADTGSADTTLTLSSGGAEFSNGISLSSNIINEAEITCTGDITINGTYGTPAGKTATFNAGSGTVTFTKNVDFSRNTFNDDSGTIKLAPPAAAAGAPENVITLGGSSSFNNFTITGSVTIEDNNSYNNFTAIDLPGKTITFPAGKTQTINNSLKFEGTSGEGNLLTLESTTADSPWYIKLAAGKTHSVNWATLKDSYNNEPYDSNYEEYLFLFNGDDKGNNKHWNCPGQSYTWTGTADSDWFNAANWNRNSVPGAGATVTIAPATNYPISDSTINLNATYVYNGTSTDYKGQVTISADLENNKYGVIDFADQSFTAGTITNSGFIYSQGINTITATKVNEDSGVVVYYGSAIATDSWGSNYKTLWFGDPDRTGYEDASGTISSVLKADTVVIKNQSTDTLSLTGANDFENPLIISENVSVAAGILTINSDSTLAIADDAYCNSLTVSSAVTINGDVTATNFQTYNGSVTLGNEITLAANTINLNGKTGDGTKVLSDYPLILDGAAVNFGSGSSVNAKYLRISNKDSTWKSTAATPLIKIDCDFFIDSTSTLTLQSDLECNNFYFFGGNLNHTGKSIKTNNMVVFGANYSADDSRYNGTDTRFAYWFTSEPAYKPAASTFANNQLTFTTTPAAAFVNTDTATINVLKNLYINGTNLRKLNIQIPANSAANPVFNKTDKVTSNQWGQPYAVSFNSNIQNVTVSAASGTAWLNAATAQKNTDGGTNTKVQFNSPKLAKVYTVYDDVIYVAFDMPLKNNNNEINTNLALTAAGYADGGVFYNGNSLQFTSPAYTDADCTTALTTGNLTTADSDGYYGFYLKAPATAKWNTDADGLSAGSSSDSTDRKGFHHNVTVDLSLLEGLFTAAEGTTLCNNYNSDHQEEVSAGTFASATEFTATEDKTAPVLVAVLTGQENHTDYNSSAGAGSQPEYDAHNFIELRYSEAVDISDGTLTLTASGGDTNIQPVATLGELSGAGLGTNRTPAAGEGLTIAGLAELSKGQLNAFNKTSSLSPHALYRAFPSTASTPEAVQSHRIRIGIAAYVEGTISYNGTDFHNWVGVIEHSLSPETDCEVTRINNTNIVDLNNNVLDSTGTALNHKLENLYVNTLAEGILDPIYSGWDSSAPQFSISWKADETSPNKYYEIVGTGAGSTLDSLELHITDNANNYDNAIWITGFGWTTPQIHTDANNVRYHELRADFSYSADLFGGSRPFATTAANRTGGGLRLSSFYDQKDKFKYINDTSDSAVPDRSFTTISHGATSSFFTGYNTPQHAIPLTMDNPYISLGLSDLSFTYETTFSVSYDESNSYITDLAGNRLHLPDGKTKLNSVDRTPPDFNLAVSPVGSDELYIMFTKHLVEDFLYKGIKYDNGYSLLPYCVSIGTISPATNVWSDYSDLTVLTSVPAAIDTAHSNQNFTTLKFKLNRKVTLEDITKLYIRIITPTATISGINFTETSPDPLTGLTGSRVTILQDDVGNYIQMYSAHALSDFALNTIDPKYAYEPDFAVDGEDSSLILDVYGTETTSRGVHDWNADQKNFGTLHYGQDITLLANKINGDDDIAPEYRLYLTDNPSAGSQSTQFNTDVNESKRVWLPAVTGLTDFKALSTSLNSTYDTVAPTLEPDFDTSDEALKDTLQYNILMDNLTNPWKDGSQVTFLFGMEKNSAPVTITHAPYLDVEQMKYTLSPAPLFALRLTDPSYPLSFDLWSFRIKSITLQRGGVTILNNVINTTNSEKTILKVNLPKEGNLKVIVMTLDGNVIKYLNNGHTGSGEHLFAWDGKNRNGKPVARGMYFIRVIGEGLDETRKVICIK